MGKVMATQKLQAIEEKQSEIDSAWVQEQKAKESLTQARKFREKLQEELGEMIRGGEAPLLDHAAAEEQGEAE